MPHVLFVYDHPDALAALTDEGRQAVYREYEALTDVPDMSGHRLQPGSGQTLTVSGDPRAAAPRACGSDRLADHRVRPARHRRRRPRGGAGRRIPAAPFGGFIAIHPLAGE